VAEALQAQLQAVSLKRGQILAPDAGPSSEWDVIACDQEAGGGLAGVSGAIPIESVLAVVSVKSNLGSAAILECAKAAAQLRAMVAQQQPGRVLPAVFAFGLDGVAADTLQSALERAIRKHGRLSKLDGVLVLGRHAALAVQVDGLLRPRDFAAPATSFEQCGRSGRRLRREPTIERLD
jgi:hypothetical protein